MSKFSYTNTFGLNSSIDAQLANEELCRIADENKGALQPQIVVDESRPEDATLHPVFEWDDFKAAEGYRREQARRLIRIVRVVDNKTPNAQPKRVWVNIPSKNQEEPTVYEKLESAIQEESKRAKLVAKAWSDLVAFRARYLEILKFSEDAALSNINQMIESKMEEMVL